MCAVRHTLTQTHRHRHLNTDTDTDTDTDTQTHTHTDTHTHTQLQNCAWETEYTLLNNSPTAWWDLHLGRRKHNKEYVTVFFFPEDNETNDRAVHKEVREPIKEPIYTEDDKLLSRVEIVAVIRKFNPVKSPGKDGLTGEIMRMDWQVR